MPNSNEQNEIWGQRLKIDQIDAELEKLGIMKDDIGKLFPLLHNGKHRTSEASISKTPDGKILLSGLGTYGFSDLHFVYRYDSAKKDSILLFEFEQGTFGKVTEGSFASQTLPLNKKVPNSEAVDALSKFLDIEKDALFIKFPLMKDFSGLIMFRMAPHTAVLAINAADATGMKSAFVYEYHVATDAMDLISNVAGGVHTRVMRRHRA